MTYRYIPTHIYSQTIIEGENNHSLLTITTFNQSSIHLIMKSNCSCTCTSMGQVHSIGT